MKVILFSLLAVVVMTTATYAQQDKSKRASPPDSTTVTTDDGVTIAIHYSKPSLKGREIGVELAPFGKVWRTGANEATELDLYKPMKLDGSVIEPGTYTLFTIPKKNEWVVIINTKTNIWGLSYDPEYDFLRFTVPSRSAAAPIESLSMAFRPDTDGFSLMIGWDDRYVEIPFESVEE